MTADPTASTSGTPGLVRDGFLAVRYDCQYVQDSFQDQWTVAGTRRAGFGETRPSQRYSFGAVGGRALTFLIPAFGGGPLDGEPIRIKAETSGPGEISLWVTKRNPDPGLDVDTAAETVRTKLVAMMSTKNPPASGSCTTSTTAPLPPISQDAPDDTPGP